MLQSMGLQRVRLSRMTEQHTLYVILYYTCHTIYVLWISLNLYYIIENFVFRQNERQCSFCIEIHKYVSGIKDSSEITLLICCHQFFSRDKILVNSSFCKTETLSVPTKQLSRPKPKQLLFYFLAYESDASRHLS